MRLYPLQSFILAGVLSFALTAYAVDEIPAEPAPAEAPAPACAELLADPFAPLELSLESFESEFEPEHKAQFGTSAKVLWKRFKILRNTPPAIAVFDEIFQPAQLQTIFSDPRHFVYFKNLSKVLDLLGVPTPTEAEPNPAYVRNAAQDFRETLTATLRTVLHNQVPAASIDGRIEALFQNPQPVNTLIRVLGDNTLQDVKELYLGPDQNAGFSPESLIGQWLQTNAGVQPIRRRFPHALHQGIQQQQAPVAPAPPADLNTPERWVIPIDATGFPSFEQFLFGPNWVSIIGHATLVQGGKVFSYSSSSFSGYRAQGPGNILPVTLLSTSEAQRLWGYSILLNKYGALTRGNWAQGQLAQHPWQIPGFLTERNIYSCCTKWIGDMPIGDMLVEEYSFPGHRDQAIEVRARLQAYQHADPLLKRIWTAPGHMQFSEMLGLKDSQIRGEFASTGWIYQVLLAQASLERVPVVFYWTAQQTTPLQPQFIYQHENAQ